MKSFGGQQRHLLAKLPRADGIARIGKTCRPRQHAVITQHDRPRECPVSIQARQGPGHPRRRPGNGRRRSHEPYTAPVPFKTTGTVFKRMRKSSRSDQLSMYSKSCRIQSSKLIVLRAFTCHSPVRPGTTQKRRNNHPSSNFETSRTGNGRGPTRDISPFSTLKSCGNSSSEVRRRNTPRRVILGSSLILKIGPIASLRRSSNGCSCSAVCTMVLNLYILNRRRFCP